MLQFKPGTDVAMLNAIMHVIVEEKLYDAPVHPGPHRGLREAQGAPQGVPAREDGGGLRHRRRDAPRPSPAPTPPPSARIIFWGMGISQHVHGTDNARCLIALALMTGQVGRPGTGLHPAARPEQRAGRVRRRPDPDGLPRLQAGRPGRAQSSASRTSGAPSSTPSPASPWSRSWTRSTPA